MRVKRRWLVVGIASILIVVVLRGCVFRPATDYPGSVFNQGTNAVWLGVEWVDEAHTPDEIAVLVDDLQRRQIRYVFVYTSFLRDDGAFNPSYDHAAEFVAAIRAMDAEIMVLAWIGLPLNAPGTGSDYHVVLDGETTRQQIVNFSVQLIHELGFDGIHLDPEPIHSGNEDVLALLDETRSALGSDGLLSIATRRIWPVYPDWSWPLTDRVAWDRAYYREVARRVDQMAVMIYDSGLPLGWIYRKWAQFQVISISRAIDGIDVEVLMGVPTSEEATATHHPRAENMRSGLEGIIDGLNDKSARSDVVDGVAIYPAWETDEVEWAIYESLWLGTK